MNETPETQVPISPVVVPEKPHVAGRFLADAFLVLVGTLGLFILVMPPLVNFLDSLGPVSLGSQVLFYAGLLLTLLIPSLVLNYFRRKNPFAFSKGTTAALVIGGVLIFLFLMAVGSAFHD